MVTRPQAPSASAAMANRIFCIASPRLPPLIDTPPPRITLEQSVSTEAGLGPPREATMSATGTQKKGRTEARPKFREEKPEGLAVRPDEPASHRTIRLRPECQRMVNAEDFFRGEALFSRRPKL